MSVEFNNRKCQSSSSKKIFGLCDDPPPAKNPAYIDEDKNNGGNWIAIVENERRKTVAFTAVDNCIDIKKTPLKMAKRCDGFLSYENKIIMIELKQRGALGNDWVKDGEIQLRSTIDRFEFEDYSEMFHIKRAYIANSERPAFKQTQIGRMEKFQNETGYVLRIVNRIEID